MRWTASFSSSTLRRGLRRAKFLASSSRQTSISFRNSVSTGLVGRRVARSGELVEGAAQDGLLGEHVPGLAPAVGVFLVRQVEQAGGRGFVAVGRALSAIVGDELFEVGQDGERKPGAPGVAPQLVGRTGIALEVDAWLLGLGEELCLATDAEGIVRGALVALERLGGLDDDFPVGGRGVQGVVDVPPQRDEQGVDELLPRLGFLVSGAAVGRHVGAKVADEPGDLVLRSIKGDRHVACLSSVGPQEGILQDVNRTGRGQRRQAHSGSGWTAAGFSRSRSQRRGLARIYSRMRFNEA